MQSQSAETLEITDVATTLFDLFSTGTESAREKRWSFRRFKRAVQSGKTSFTPYCVDGFCTLRGRKVRAQRLQVLRQLEYAINGHVIAQRRTTGVFGF